MEAILELYRQPYDLRYPVVCMDEACKQLIGETRIPLPLGEGQGSRNILKALINAVRQAA